ncbi:uncharacterized protein LOC110862090 [Folsomia candida]|uniref:uncharacterized protein LOC110862090 n=1 Tax=Folsomia candida TaxID=158441 RepID=UPI0016050DC4|nr:uncharacterized protein LOC110862090 [Folsomia candida]
MDFVSSTNGKSAEERINVILLGFDATSRMNFLRTMPKSNAYLLKNLSAIVMEGYTKVAENTLPNVIPVLSGHTLGEFKRKCMDLGADSGSVHVDECPFIWKRFSTNGFRTGFAEDDVGIGIFNMNWRHAFEKPPTDYYLRPFSNLMQAKQSSGDGQCYGTRLSFKVLLDNLENTAVTLKNHPFFHFTWATKLSHNNPNHLALGDIPLLRFLRFMHRDGHLNRTVLVLMSDHGSRLDGIRSTSQGKVEDRMPLFYLVPPPWFATRFPTAYQNLKANSDKLTSAFDLHETLLDLMDLSRLDNLEGRDVNADEISSRQRKASSLFQPISHNRTCLRAGIPLHWCVCRGDSVQRPMVDVESEEVQSAVRYAVDTMNYHLRWQHSCATLTLQKTTDAFYIDFESKEKLGSADEKPADGDTDKFTILRLSFTTLPGEGAFEASLVRGVVKGSWLLAEKVVRTNEYGDQSHCVDQDFKEFCYCT